MINVWLWVCNLPARSLKQYCQHSCSYFKLSMISLMWSRYYDFRFVEKRFQSCQSDLSSFVQLCELLGIPVAMEKTSDLPLQMLVILGILLDTIKMIAQLPEDKLHAYTEQVGLTLDKSKVPLRELKGIIGRLQFVTSVVTVGKAFLCHMHDLTIGVSKP